MNKVIDSNIANSIFNKITNNRLWIIIDYSGEDFIFDQLARLGRFDNGLYWVCYKNNDPIKRVQEDLLNKPNTESFLIKGFDSDSFFLKLNAELKNEDPKIFSIPFHFLSELQENIRDIDDDEVYKSVKERLIESKRMVQDAINRYETKSTEPPMSDEEIENTQLKKALIDCLTSGKYEDLAGLENQTKVKESKDLRQIVSDIYYNWGTYLGNLAQIKSGDEAESFFKQAFEKFDKAVDLGSSYYNFACIKAISKNIKEAFRLLEICLQKEEITFKFVEKDSDWNNLREETEYKRLKQLYLK